MLWAVLWKCGDSVWPPPDYWTCSMCYYAVDAYYYQIKTQQSFIIYFQLFYTIKDAGPFVPFLAQGIFICKYYILGLYIVDLKICI